MDAPLDFEEIPTAEIGLEPTYKPQVADPFMRLDSLRMLMGNPSIFRVISEAADGKVDSVYVHDAEALHQVLEGEDGLWLKGPQTIEPFRSVVPLHLIALDGQEHTKLRRAAQRSMNDQVQSRVTRVAYKHALRLRAFWARRIRESARPDRSHETIALDRAVRATTTDIITELVLGEPWGSLTGLDRRKIDPRVSALRQLMIVLHWRIVDMTNRDWRTQPSGTGAATGPLNVLKPLLREAIEQARAAAPLKSEQDRDEAPWVKLFVDDPAGLSDDEVENLCLTFLTMGHENISTSISWCLIHLAENPDVQDRIRSEVLQSGLFATGSRGPTKTDWDAIEKMQDIPAWTALQRLKSLEAAFLESARLMPSVAVVTRRPARDTVLLGHRIPKDQEVIFSLYGYHRDTSLFGKKAGSFQCPRAHLRDDAPPRPFGGGARICIGRPLSSVESKAIVAALLAEFSLSSTSPEDVRPYNFVSLRPGAHRIVFRALSAAPSL
ncbi:Cytochrome P450 714B1 [Hondaea fermentalgiana]|uniref:Cytochrome P450 714B1 n=1 Tax=Hondaea fermentalgiana TaxID=2315210 RepID=A0A2R5GUL6_9STRA|nr:Cytochrome P450 714B1 [Hondaea fermentalgiana]|eukprot:GBG31584.1 Cytochrome P450 714B1 [Hondaea fermentalgiana]